MNPHPFPFRIPLRWGVVLALACGSAAAPPSRAASDCLQAAGVFLQQRTTGDSTATLLADLAQALECAGKIEEAVGATYLPLGPDSTGKAELLLVRAQLLRELGLDDVARLAEEEAGRKVSGPGGGGAESSGWVLDRRPGLSTTVGWIGQWDRPRSASLSNAYQRLLDSGLSVSDASSRQTSDFVLIEGGSFIASAGLSWGAWSGVGGFSVGPSGSVSFPDDSTTWRSGTVGGDLNALFGPGPSTTVALSVSGSRTWFRSESGPMTVQDEFVASFTPSWKPSPWTLSLPQSLRALRSDGTAWGWTGQHSVSCSRTLLPWASANATVDGAWYLDGTRDSDQDRGYQVRLEGTGFAPGQRLYSAGNNLAGFLDSVRLQSRIDSRVATTGSDTITTPVARNQSWVQLGLGAGIALGPWRGVAAGLSGGWNATSYLHRQEGDHVDPVLGYWDPSGGIVVISDTTTHQDYVVRSISYRDAPVLVPLRWRARRHDRNWSLQATASWRPAPWFSTRIAWSWTRNTSDLEDRIDGASYVRNVISVSGNLSW